MVYKKIQNEKGNYKNTNDVRFDVLEATEAFTPQGKNAGWETFANMQTALQHYGLTYDPLPEALE